MLRPSPIVRRCPPRRRMSRPPSVRSSVDACRRPPHTRYRETLCWGCLALQSPFKLAPLPFGAVSGHVLALDVDLRRSWTPLIRRSSWEPFATGLSTCLASRLLRLPGKCRRTRPADSPSNGPILQPFTRAEPQPRRCPPVLDTSTRSARGDGSDARIGADRAAFPRLWLHAPRVARAGMSARQPGPADAQALLTPHVGRDGRAPRRRSAQGSSDSAQGRHGVGGSPGSRNTECGRSRPGARGAGSGG
jgi:hypothetical protein